MKHRRIILISAMVLIGATFVFFYASKRKLANSKSPATDALPLSGKEIEPVETGAKPEKNPRNGSVKIVEDFIKSNAKNPSTFEFLEWSDISIEGGYWKVRCKYRGVSSFNAEVTTNAWFYIKNKKVVYTKTISKI
ncbi:MAG TPA: hypothetical protein VL728_11165 [Cyclobacteriaceae bacterium]|nr:hypothetical protein [Cyclobacteriaceae bacterium]